MWTIMKKEFKNYFLSPIGYIFIGLCLAMCSIFFYMTAIARGVTNYEHMFYYVAQALVFVTPILTMRMFAEERKNGTEILLVTSPKTTTGIVLGKFFAAVSVIAIMEVCTLVYFGILCYFGMPDVLIGLVTLLGILLVSMSYISFGMMISTVTENQIIAGIVTLGSFIAMWFLPSVNSKFATFSLLERFFSFPQGLISTTDVVALLSATIVFTIVTIILLERRKLLK